jgi:hypothetical protein
MTTDLLEAGGPPAAAAAAPDSCDLGVLCLSGLPALAGTSPNPLAMAGREVAAAATVMPNSILGGTPSGSPLPPASPSHANLPRHEEGPEEQEPSSARSLLEGNASQDDLFQQGTLATSQLRGDSGPPDLLPFTADFCSQTQSCWAPAPAPVPVFGALRAPAGSASQADGQSPATPYALPRKRSPPPMEAGEPEGGKRPRPERAEKEAVLPPSEPSAPLPTPCPGRSDAPALQPPPPPAVPTLIQDTQPLLLRAQEFPHLRGDDVDVLRLAAGVLGPPCGQETPTGPPLPATNAREIPPPPEPMDARRGMEQPARAQPGTSGTQVPTKPGDDDAAPTTTDRLPGSPPPQSPAPGRRELRVRPATALFGLKEACQRAGHALPTAVRDVGAGAGDGVVDDSCSEDEGEEATLPGIVGDSQVINLPPGLHPAPCILRVGDLVWRPGLDGFHHPGTVARLFRAYVYVVDCVLPATAATAPASFPRSQVHLLHLRPGMECLFRPKRTPMPARILQAGPPADGEAEAEVFVETLKDRRVRCTTLASLLRPSDSLLAEDAGELAAEGEATATPRAELLRGLVFVLDSPGRYRAAPSHCGRMQAHPHCCPCPAHHR